MQNSKVHNNRTISLEPHYNEDPNHILDCQCIFCHYHIENTNKKNLQTRQNMTKTKIRLRTIKRKDQSSEHYQWILSRLIAPHNKIIDKLLDMYIPEIVFYREGEPVQMFINRQFEMKKNIYSYDSTVKKINKDKITNNYIQKIFNDRRRKYRDWVKSQKGIKKVESKKKSNYGKVEVKEVKDAVVIKYHDGHQYMISQNDFHALSMRRKQDSIWKQIAYIRNYISIPPNQPDRFILIKHKREQISDPELYDRAKTLMKVYGHNILETQPEYISEGQQKQFCKQLLEKSPKTLALYSVYKIIHYIFFFYDEKIIKISAGFTLSQKNHLFLTNVHKLVAQEGLKFDWTPSTIDTKVKEEDQRIFKNRNIEMSPEYEQGSQIIEEQMLENYEKMKDDCGLNDVEEDNTEEIKNNQFFRKIYPSFKGEFTEIMKNPQVTVSDFKTSYLGMKREKSPVFKDFNSMMIKTLHFMSPRLKRTAPHDLIKHPRRKLLPLDDKKPEKRMFNTIEKQSNLSFMNKKSKTVSFRL